MIDHHISDIFIRTIDAIETSFHVAKLAGPRSCSAKARPLWLRPKVCWGEGGAGAAGGCTFDTGHFGTWFIWVQHDETWNASVQVSTAPSDFFLHRCSQIRPTRSEKPKHRQCHGPTLLSLATRCASCGHVRGWTRPVVCKRSRCQWLPVVISSLTLPKHWPLVSRLQLHDVWCPKACGAGRMVDDGSRCGSDRENSNIASVCFGHVWIDDFGSQKKRKTRQPVDSAPL